jgi:hypothetical protein
MGLGGGQVACLAAVVAGYLYQVRRVANVTGLDLAQYWKSLAAPLAISLVMGAFCFGVSFIPGLGRPFLNIALGAGICLFTYAGSLAWVLQKTPNAFVPDGNQATIPS